MSATSLSTCMHLSTSHWCQTIYAYMGKHHNYWSNTIVAMWWTNLVCMHTNNTNCKMAFGNIISKVIGMYVLSNVTSYMIIAICHFIILCDITDISMQSTKLTRKNFRNLMILNYFNFRKWNRNRMSKK